MSISVAGSGTIVGDDGTTTVIAPGVVLVTPDGWSGTWHVRETVRKICKRLGAFDETTTHPELDCLTAIDWRAPDPLRIPLSASPGHPRRSTPS